MPVKVEPPTSKSGGKSSSPRKTFLKEVEAQFPERPSARRKICFLFRNSDVNEFFRVNFFQHSGEYVESYWIEVKDGVVGVTAEENLILKLNPK